MSDEAQQNAGEEPSMEDILASIRRILSEDEEEEAAAEAAPAPEPEEEMDMAAAMAAEEPEEEMDMAAAMAAEEPEEEMDMAAAMAADALEEEPEEEMDMAAAMAMDEAAPDLELADPEPEPIPAPAPIPAPVAAPAPAPAPIPAPEPMYAAPPPPAPPAPVRPGGEPDMTSIFDLTAEMITTLPEGTSVDSIMSASSYNASTDVLGDLARAILSQRELQVGGNEVTLEGMVKEMMRPLLSEWLDQNLPYLIERLVKKEIDHMINRAERLD